MITTVLEDMSMVIVVNIVAAFAGNMEMGQMILAMMGVLYLFLISCIDWEQYYAQKLKDWVRYAMYMGTRLLLRL